MYMCRSCSKDEHVVAEAFKRCGMCGYTAMCVYVPKFTLKRYSAIEQFKHTIRERTIIEV